MSKLPSDLKPHEVLNVNVGVLGHVDSGKTSLVKALSTLLSTASLDKNPQSIARGITLDLGFSAFLLPLPARLENQMAAAAATAAEAQDATAAPPAAPFRALQFTLVDCPGHASLIRTIIGGAQIIDMMILVVNVLKGIQTQTAECLVIGEICTKHLIVVLNKVDLIPAPERAARVAAAEKGIRSALKATKFANCPIVATAAAVGGEKVAAIAAQAKHLRDRATAARDSADESTSSSSAGSVTMGAPASFSSSSDPSAVSDAAASGSLPVADATSTTPTEEASSSTALSTSSALEPMTSFALVPNLGLNDLLNVINTIVELPSRRDAGPFYFSIDHCFPIKGQGTVITGTVLSGTVKVNDMVEIPYLRETKKVKSMQMFHKNVKSARQGDRLGLCLQGLDSKLVERGVASSPGTVPALHGAVALVQRIRYFKGAIRSGAKVHVTIGHATVLATVTFFGHSEIYGHRTSYTAAAAAAAVAATSHQGSAGDASSGGGVDDKGSNSSKGAKESNNMKENSKEAVTSLAAASGAGDLPTDDLHFDWHNDYLWQDEMRRGRGGLNKRNQNDNDDDEGSGVTDSEANSASENTSNLSSSSSSSSLRPTAGTVDEMVHDSGKGPVLPGLQWAMLEFETAVYTPLQGLLVASRLDTDVNTSNCRIAFFGKMVTRVQVPSDPPRLKTFKFKTRVGTIAKLGAAAFATTALAAEAALTGDLPPNKKKGGSGNTGGSSSSGGSKVSEVYGKDLFKKETDMKQFIGRKVVTESGAAGIIDSAFGQSGKFKVIFKQAGGVAVKVGERLFLQFKRFTNDATKAMVQDAECLQLQPGWKDLRPSEEAIAASAADTSTSAVPQRGGSSTNAKASAKKKKTKKSSAASSSLEEQSLEGKGARADSSEKASLQAPSSTAAAAAPTRAGGGGGSTTVVTPPQSAGAAAAHVPLPPLPPLPPKELVLAREGKVAKVKDSGPINGQGPWLVICEGLFRPEEDVRLFEGRPVHCFPPPDKTETNGGTKSTGVIAGVLIGPFGKGGKCKVEYPVEVPVNARVNLE